MHFSMILFLEDNLFSAVTKPNVLQLSFLIKHKTINFRKQFISIGLPFPVIHLLYIGSNMFSIHVCIVLYALSLLKDNKKYRHKLCTLRLFCSSCKN